MLLKNVVFYIQIYKNSIQINVERTFTERSENITFKSWNIRLVHICIGDF